MIGCHLGSPSQHPSFCYYVEKSNTDDAFYLLCCLYVRLATVFKLYLSQFAAELYLCHQGILDLTDHCPSLKRYRRADLLLQHSHGGQHREARIPWSEVKSYFELQSRIYSLSNHVLHTLGRRASL